MHILITSAISGSGQKHQQLKTNPAAVGSVLDKGVFTWNSFCFCGTLLSTCLRAELEMVRRATCWSAWKQHEPAKSPHERGHGPVSHKNTLHVDVWSRYFVKEKLKVSIIAAVLDDANGS